ncbi:45_t:CDS:1, partial [Acaulospora colombiana]
EEQENEDIDVDDNAKKEKDNFNSDRLTADTSESCNIEEFSPDQTCDIGSIESSQSDHEDSLPPSPVSASLEREENFLRQLGWQKPYDKDDDSQWAITEEERRLFINLVRALNGVSINENNEVDTGNTLSNGEINRANKNWAATVMIKKQQNGNICIQNEDSKANNIECLRLLV